MGHGAWGMGHGKEAINALYFGLPKRSQFSFAKMVRSQVGDRSSY
ncbi:hypothetical protein [aff. Roholtiella sp. LEGE 12411]